jgi:cell division protein FtsN
MTVTPPVVEAAVPAGNSGEPKAAEAKPSPAAEVAAEAAPSGALAPVPAQPVVAEVPVPAASDSPAAVAPLRTRERGFGVSVGLFAVEANAQRAAATLSGAGLPVISDPIESARGPMTRVRVGPFETRAQAESAAERVRALGLEARVYAP